MRVVVVGGGIVGASTAFHLADADARLDVIVVDRSHPGKATLAGAGIICPWPTAATDEELVRLYVGGAEAIPEIVDRLAELGCSTGSYRRIGAIALAADDTELAAIEGRIAARSAMSPIVGEVQRVGGSEARRRFPPLRRDLAGIWIEGGARLDGRAMAEALLRGADVESRSGQVELVVEGGRVRGVVLGDERIDADAVVVAGGAWADALLAPHGVTVGVEPQKGQILHLDVGERHWPPTDEWPSILPPGPHYLVPFDGGRVVVGATRERGSGFDTRVTVAGQREVLDAALLWAPGLADAALIETRVGLRPLASTGRPMIGRAPGVEGLLVGTGLGAAGLTIGPLAGRMLADQVLAT